MLKSAAQVLKSVAQVPESTAHALAAGECPTRTNGDRERRAGATRAPRILRCKKAQVLDSTAHVLAMEAARVWRQSAAQVLTEHRAYREARS